MRLRPCFLVFALAALAGCAGGSQERGLERQRGLFASPFAYGQILLTQPSVRHPPYVICNGRNCALLDEEGNYTRMSDDERRAWRERIRQVDENEQGKGRSAAEPEAVNRLRPKIHED